MTETTPTGRPRAELTDAQRVELQELRGRVDLDRGLVREARRRPGARSPDYGPEGVIPPRVDSQVRRQRAPVHDSREIFRAREITAIGADCLVGVLVVLVDAHNRGFEAGGLAGAFEIEELAQADGEDEDGDYVEDKERAIEGPDRVEGSGAHRRQFIQRCCAFSKRRL